MSDFLLSVPGRLTTLINNMTTLLTRWTQTKADYVDSPISTRAPSSTALDKNIWTDSRAARLDYLDFVLSQTLDNVTNPVLNPVNSLNGIVEISGLMSITPPYGVITTPNVVAVSGGVYYEVLNITGKGVIGYLDVGIASGHSGTGGFRLTIDGVAITAANLSANLAGNLIFGTITTAGIITTESIPFRSQFKLEVSSVGAGANFRARHRYRKTA